MSKKYTSPEHAIRNIMEGATSKLFKTGEAIFGGAKTALSYDEILSAIKRGEKITDDMLKGLSPNQLDDIKYEMQKASAKPKPAEEPSPEPTPEPAPAPEKPANDPNPPGVVPIKEPTVPSVEPYKVPKWEPKEPLKPANDPVPSKPAPVETPAPKPAPVETPAPKPSTSPSFKPSPDVGPAAAPKPAAVPSPKLSPEAQPVPRSVPAPKTPQKTPTPRGIPFGGITPGQPIALTAGSVTNVDDYLHMAKTRTPDLDAPIHKESADEERRKIENVARPNSDRNKVMARNESIKKKIIDENTAKKNIILQAIKDKKSSPSVDLNPKIKSTNPGEQ